MARFLICCSMYGWLLLGPAPSLFAQPAPQGSELSVADSLVNVQPMPAPHELVFGEENLKPVRQQQDFAYMAVIDSILRQQKFNPEYKKEVNELRPTSEGWIRPLAMMLTLLLLLFLLFKIWTKYNGIFTPRDQKSDTETEDLAVDPLMQEGAADLAQKAIANKQYRLATRYLFIDTLAKLEERGLIQRMARKTNQQYLNELKQPELKELLAAAMLQFEYVWYGEFTPSEEQFQRIYKTFQELEAKWC